ncbi:MAG: hypothetical protein ACKVVT_19625 [Dehalococcoidia bacterium]
MENGVVELSGKIVGAAERAHLTLEPFEGPLRDHIAATFPGIEFSLRAGDDFSAQFAPDGSSLSATWVLFGERTGKDANGGRARPFLNCPWNEAEGEGHRQIVLWVFTAGRTIDGGWRFASRFDTLSAMGQMGVAVVGRPVARPIRGRVKVAEAFAAADLFKATPDSAGPEHSSSQSAS